MKFEIKRTEKGIQLGKEIKENIVDNFDICPMGCGRTTDDFYGGPCSECWKEV